MPPPAPTPEHQTESDQVSAALPQAVVPDRPAPGQMFATRGQARAELFEYLEVFYNRVRLHSSLGFLYPEEFERTYNQKRR